MPRHFRRLMFHGPVYRSLRHLWIAFAMLSTTKWGAEAVASMRPYPGFGEMVLSIRFSLFSGCRPSPREGSPSEMGRASIPAASTAASLPSVMASGFLAIRDGWRCLAGGPPQPECCGASPTRGFLHRSVAAPLAAPRHRVPRASMTCLLSLVVLGTLAALGSI